MLTAELEQAGLAVTAAGSFRDSQDLLGSMEFDLAVLDVMLPDGSGLDLARRLKAQHPGIGIIMLTRYDQASWRRSEERRVGSERREDGASDISSNGAAVY